MTDTFKIQTFVILKQNLNLHKHTELQIRREKIKSIGHLLRRCKNEENLFRLINCYCLCFTKKSQHLSKQGEISFIQNKSFSPQILCHTHFISLHWTFYQWNMCVHILVENGLVWNILKCDKFIKIDWKLI